jgi:hypothetical protein
MTGEQSRRLGIGDRVRWGGPTADFGTIIGTAWSGVTIAWDDGDTDLVRHNDMKKIERAPTKLV